ncbi:hypothetical protein EAX61_10575 [Dokdonia sinensis]|uniref:Lipocalin-like domain-containing protein n=1 Tax=Dokdonia sinensis TaxID=2479847 RepID=A0A3M0FXU7_9FLAO|nr:lipocalin family protein [Dokdonia sinensis]RMB57560.1 hypothetical protein EAX61_10575 [Dokdonia sinensis]
MRWVIVVLVFVAYFSCSENKSNLYQVPENVHLLIAGDSTKVWKIAKRYNGKTRMNMGDCFLSYRQTFKSDGTVFDNNEENYDCGPSLRGSWAVLKDSLGYSNIRISSPQIGEIFGMEKDYKDFKIFYVSADSLHISFLHDQFGQRRRISDYLVREDVSVSDRNFHF